MECDAFVRDFVKVCVAAKKAGAGEMGYDDHATLPCTEHSIASQFRRLKGPTTVKDCVSRASTGTNHNIRTQNFKEAPSVSAELAGIRHYCGFLLMWGIGVVRCNAGIRLDW